MRFFQAYEGVLYTLLGLAAAIYLYRFAQAWQEMRGAVFGLEKESARQRLNQAALALLALILMGVGVFSVVAFIAPGLPIVDDATLNQFAIASGQTPTLLSLASPGTPGTAAVTGVPTATRLPTVAVLQEGCIPDELNITSPQAGETLRGIVEVTGTVNVPDFGFYKFEVARAQEELWLTIQAGRTIIVEGILVAGWDTSRLPPGDYVIQLLATQSNGQALPPCRVPVRIGSAP